MSIIHEALKKTQNNIKPAAKPHTAPVASPATPVQPPHVQEEIPAAVTPTPEPPAQHIQTVKPAPVESKSRPQSVHSQKRMVGLTISAIAIVIVLSLVWSRRQNAAVQTNEPPVPTSAYNVITAAPLEKKAQQTKTSSSQTEITLQGVSVTGDKRFALINGDIYEIGDEIYGKKIVNISENSVEISEGNQTVILKTRRK